MLNGKATARTAAARALGDQALGDAVAEDLSDENFPESPARFDAREAAAIEPAGVAPAVAESPVSAEGLGRGAAPGTPLPQAQTDHLEANCALLPAPKHVAIIMDGNGRWAKARFMPRIAGHRRGADTVRDVVRACPGLGVEVLTLFAFSTENWSRSEEEVSGLMDLFRYFLRRETQALAREGVQVRFIGDRGRLAPDICALMSETEAATRDNHRLTLVIALNYGARAEIAAAARGLAERVARGELDPAAIDETTLDSALLTAHLPDPDLIIRTSGEQRLSNFLLWQSAYSELVFAPEAWPEFSGESLRRAIEAYRRRDRRYGATSG